MENNKEQEQTPNVDKEALKASKDTHETQKNNNEVVTKDDSLGKPDAE